VIFSQQNSIFSASYKIIKKMHPHIGFSAACLVLSSFNGRPCARWLGRKGAALVIGSGGVTSINLGGLTRAYWTQTVQLGRQRRKASSRGTFRSDKLAGLNFRTARKPTLIPVSTGALNLSSRTSLFTQTSKRQTKHRRHQMEQTK